MVKRLNNVISYNYNHNINKQFVICLLKKVVTKENIIYKQT